MGESEARAMGMGNTITVKTDGREKTYTLRPVSVLHLCDASREALEFYKRQFLETYTKNADLLGEVAQGLIERKFDEAAQWSLDDLPKKTAFDVSRVPINDRLKVWARAFQDQEGMGEEDGELTDRRVRALLLTALDQERVRPEQVKKLTGRVPIQGRVRYDQWWVTGCFEGMVSFIYSSIRYEHPEATKETIRAWPITAVFEAARAVESVTTPDLGNG